MEEPRNLVAALVPLGPRVMRESIKGALLTPFSTPYPDSCWHLFYAHHY